MKANKVKADMQKFLVKFLKERKSNTSNAIALNLPAIKKYPRDIQNIIMKETKSKLWKLNKARNNQNNICKILHIVIWLIIEKFSNIYSIFNNKYFLIIIFNL